MSFKPLTEERYRQAILEGKQRLATSLIAEDVRYAAGSDEITITLPLARISVARSAILEFAALPVDAMQGLHLSAIGDALGVEGFDVEVDLKGLIIGVLPEPLLSTALARRGGAAKSSAKSAAARTNGAKGGRPRKLQQTA